MIGFGLIIPVMPELIRELTGLPANEAVLLGMVLIISYAGDAVHLRADHRCAV